MYEIMAEKAKAYKASVSS